MSNENKLDFWVISHTHWDREWYMPLEHMKIRLISLFDNLLKILDEQPDYVFHMDAQTIVLEDYLEIRPDNRGKIQSYVEEGRLLVGPWYVQNDFYLSSGEATVRNILIGSEIAEEFGKCGKVGYCPDQFGNIAQLPQIFNQFGIESCVFGRGHSRIPQPVQEFYWQGEDGSKVLCNYMTYWYNNAQRFSPDIGRSMNMISFIENNMKKVSISSQYLLMNGVDHLEAQDDILPILSEVQKKLPEGQRIFQGSLEDYMEALRRDLEGKDIETVTGEMRDGDRANVLAGTLSSRIDLKQFNDRCQMLLERNLEPLYTALFSMGIGRYPKEYFRYLWKLLLQNLAHDSICGCSVDAVNLHMADRYMRVEEGALMMLESGMDKLQQYISRDGMDEKSYLLTLFNPVQEERTELMEAVVDILEDEDAGTVLIQDTMGDKAQYKILSRERKARGLISPINLPGVINVISYRVQLEVEKLPGFSYRTYTVTPVERLDESCCEQQSECLENSEMKVTVNDDGTINVLSKKTGKSWNGLLELRDTADIGDSYIFISAGDNPVSSTNSGKVQREWLQNDSFSQRLRLTFNMPIPEAYHFEEKKRSETKVDCPVSMVLTLDRLSDWLKAEITFVNSGEDHRLRVKFPVEAGDVSFAGNPFDCTERSRAAAHSGYAIGDQPFSEYVWAGGLSIFAEGLHEYEHCMDDSLEISILRATGVITRDANPDILVEDKWIVPGNQCIGEHRVELAICPGAESPEKAARLAKAYNTPVVQGYQPYDPKKFTGGRPFVQGTDTPEFYYVPKEFPEKEIPADKAFFSARGAVVSAWKQADDHTIAVRLYNVSSKEEDVSIHFFDAPGAVYRSGLSEERGEKLEITGGCLHIKAAPKGIITLLVSAGTL